MESETSKVNFEYTLVSFDKDFSIFAEKFRIFCEKYNVDQSKTFDMEVSLEELIVNSFFHGRTDGHVKVLAVLKNGELMVQVQDSAPPFNLLREASELPQGDLISRKVGGLGIHLVKNLNDRVEYSGSKQGNKVTLFKKL